MQFAHTAFFKMLVSFLGPNINAVQWVAEVLDCSETSAWRKMNGDRGLQISEMLLLCAAEPKLAIEAAELFPWHQLKVIQIRSFINEEEFHAYLLAIEKMLHEAALHSDFRLRYMARDLPLFYFLGNATLLKHKFRLWTSNGNASSGILSSRTIELAQGLFKRYMEIPTEEIWFEDAFGMQYKQLEIFEQAGELHPNEAEEMGAYYKSLEIQQAHWIKTQKKPEGGELLAAFCPVALTNNGALLHSHGKEQLLGSIMSVQYFYSHNPGLIHQFNSLWTKHLSWCLVRPEELLYRDKRYKEEYLSAQKAKD